MTHFTDSNFFWLLHAALNSQPELYSMSEEYPELIWLIPITFIFALVGMAFQTSGERSERSPREMRRDVKATTSRLLAKFGNQLKADGVKLMVAIYIRYSSMYQDSFESQLLSALQKAADMGFAVSEENIFFDLAVSGGKRDRTGLDAICEARKNGKFQVFISLATSRLARDLKTLLEVLDEELVGNGIRCILTDQNLDSDDKQKWNLLMPLLGWLDDIHRTSHAGHIVASHKMLLSRGLRYSTDTYGYCGQPIAGYFTKRGRPVELIVVEDATTIVVSLIFEKFLSGTPVARIVKQLNEDPTLPRPPKSKKNRFSRDFVMKVLQNVRYLGIFVYRGDADVSDLSPDEMRALATSHGSVFSFPNLQIVSDEAFLDAKQKLRDNADQPHLRKPRSKRSHSNKRPRLLNGFLFCPGCDNQLVATGAHGNSFGCKSCKHHPKEQQHLYSQMPRKLATEMVVEAICEGVFANEEVLEKSVDAMVNAAKEIQQPDPNKLKILEGERKRVKGQLKLLLSNFGGDSSNLIKDELASIRSELTRLDSDIAKHQRLESKVVSVPTESEARELLQDFGKALRHFAFNADGEELDKARRIIQLVTGGRIDAYQRGEKAAQRGWCQLRFNANPAALLYDAAAIPAELEGDESVPVVIDIRQEASVNPKIAMARELYDQDFFENEIAEKLGAGRASICNWIRESYAAEGKTKPDGYQRRKRIEAARGLHHYQKISDQVFELAESGMKLQDIAERLKTNRDVITKALAYAREKRGLPPLDGRTRRKSLPRKPR